MVERKYEKIDEEIGKIFEETFRMLSSLKEIDPDIIFSEIFGLPQIVPVTGVSADYWNELGVVPAFWGEFSLSENLDYLRNKPRRKYFEYSPDLKDDANLIPGYNKERVERLELIAEEMNALAAPEITAQNFDLDSLVGLLGESLLLIYGKEAGGKFANQLAKLYEEHKAK